MSEYEAKLRYMISRINRFNSHKEFFDSPAVFRKQEAEHRLDKILSIEVEVDKSYTELEQLVKPEEQTSVAQIFDVFSSACPELIGYIRAWIEAQNPAAQAAATTASPNSATASVQKPKIKFPTISLPEFDGALEKWLTFRDTFESMVHNNDQLSLIEKYHYLKTSIKLPTNQPSVLDNFSLTADCYESAWAAVKDRYDDKRKLKAEHFTTLLTIKKMTSETPAEIRRLLDTFSATITVLNQLGATYDDLLVHVVQHRMDEPTLREWQRALDEDMPTWPLLKNFLKSQWRRLDQIQPQKKSSASLKPSEHKYQQSAKPSKTFTSNDAPLRCVLCSGDHFLYHCQQFKDKSIYDRGQFASASKLCRNCLSAGHHRNDCTSKRRCRTCQGLHHTMLHWTSAPAASSDERRSSQPPQAAYHQPRPSAPPFVPQPRPNVKVPNQQGSSSHHVTQSYAVHHQSLLSTIQCDMLDSQGRYHPCRVLLDNGSQSNHMTMDMARKLQLPLLDVYQPCSGINGITTIVRHQAHATFKSRYMDYQQTHLYNVSPSVTAMLPNQFFATTHLQIPKDCFIADPNFNAPAPIDVIMGQLIFNDSLIGDKIKLPGNVYMTHYKFGWAFGGLVSSVAPQSTLVSSFSFHSRSGMEELDDKLEKFMALEDYGLSTKLLSSEEQYCENLYNDTTIKDVDQRYVVQFPFKQDVDKLQSNHNNALRQFHAQEKARQKDPVLDQKYSDYMKMLIDRDFMTETDSSTYDEGFYLPHHGVKKETSTTTKVRPVFNGSSKASNGISLNDCLCVGPTVQPELIDIMLRFREKPFVLKSDVEKMYLQVRVHQPHRKYQKLLWRFAPTEILRHYELNSVTFGLSSSSFLATRTVNQIAMDNVHKFPDAAQIVRTSFNVDDLLFGCNSIAEGIQLRDHIRFMMTQACMPLCKWASNDPHLLTNLLPSDIEPLDTENSFVKTLGHNWFPEQDQLSLNFKSMKEGPVTKTSVLSEIASIYDPLGIVGPVVLTGKLFIKTLWELKLDWKQPLPDSAREEWNSFRKFLPALNELFIDRHATIANPVKVELHGFCDASSKGYGAVLYFRSTDSIGHVQVNIICSKSRVSPHKKISSARRELCSAVLLAKLILRIISSTSLTLASVVLWSDSMITLYWIISESSQLSTFVGNRVAVIQEHTRHHIWKHIRGEENPADLISRGLMPYEIATADLWWNGPSFLEHDESTWPESCISINEDDSDVQSELRKTVTLTNLESCFSFFNYIENKFGRLELLIRTFAYIKRFAHNAKKNSNRKNGSLSIDEIDDATRHIIKIVQQSMFPLEHKFLVHLIENPATKQVFPTKSSILSLAPFMDNDRVIRVGGRIGASPVLTEQQKHPIVLPQCHFSTLVIRHLHNKHSHPGPLMLLSLVRETYWPLRAKSMIRQVIHQCVLCTRTKPKLAAQIMGSLPAARVTMTPPFQSTSVDYAGHFNLRSSLTHRATIVKAYIAVFKCMSTGAIHLELVTSLSTPAFIAAFDRFISRRGLCAEIFSDNGTNFVGANNELKQITDTIEPGIAEHLKTNSIKWHFTVPLAPHAGGYYESGVKTMKHYLIRVLENHSFDFEQFSTILCKIEAIINSRPLMPLSEDPSDLQALTPGHFLIGRALLAKPERNLRDTSENRVDKWNKLQQVQQKFWDMWYHHYLHYLQTRPLHFRENNKFFVDDLVLIKDQNLPPLKWLIGRISEVFPGKDKVVRNVRVRTMKDQKERFYDRHVKYLCLLPLEQSSVVGQNVRDQRHETN